MTTTKAPTVILPSGREVPAVKCPCGDGSCNQCSDEGFTADTKSPEYLLDVLCERLGEEYEIVNRQFEYESDRFNVRAPNGDWVLETDEPTEWDAITTAADLL